MRLAVDSINDKKIQIQEDVPAKEWDLDSDDITFLGSVHIDCECFKVHNEIVVQAKVTTQRKVTCSRCLNSVTRTLSQDFMRSYSTEKLGEYLDLDPDIREEILLSFPGKVLCSPDCKGLCSGCGLNLNLEKCKCPKGAKPQARINNIDY